MVGLVGDTISWDDSEIGLASRECTTRDGHVKSIDDLKMGKYMPLTTAIRECTSNALKLGSSPILVYLRLPSEKGKLRETLVGIIFCKRALSINDPMFCRLKLCSVL
mmetsp:Transcript_19539/g.42481  ORF Transcript_19539/g.42481 Transcript_19539/m.42481 type:complete len:107 (-) Transcript_19539:2273-2593(-)